MVKFSQLDIRTYGQLDSQDNNTAIELDNRTKNQLQNFRTRRLDIKI